MRKHFYLNNQKSNSPKFKRGRNYSQTDDKSHDNVESKVIRQPQRRSLHSNYEDFHQMREKRYANRTLELPLYIDVIEIRFYTNFNQDLKTKFNTTYGLMPMEYKDFNKTVLFEVVDEEGFENFKNHIEFIINSKDDLEYSGKSYNLIALIHEFSFFDKRIKSLSAEGVCISLFHFAQSNAFKQKNTLIKFLDDSEANYRLTENSELLYLENATEETLLLIDRNFDIVKGITSSRTAKVRPGMYGDVRFDYGFEVVIPDNLPIIGVIDTGVTTIGPFEGLVVDTINLTSSNDSDHTGHGTMVAGLAIFGQDFPSTANDTYLAKSKVLSIKTIDQVNDAVDFPALLEAIVAANKDYGVRIFNMSLVFDSPKQYNASYSDFAYELDKLSYDLDIIVFISVGNFNDTSLNELLTIDYHPTHEYPEFFYSLDSDSHVHSCENTNICPPSDSLNNISVGALAGNLERRESSDLTPLSVYPAYYTRKFNFDYTQEVNGTTLRRNRTNKYLNKPDFVFEGGDLHVEESGMEVMTHEGEFYCRTAGTSLATPLIASMATEIISIYPELNMESVKALLINSSSYEKSKDLPLFENEDNLLKKLIGFGKPNRSELLEGKDNSISLIIEDYLQNEEIVSIPIFLPDYLLATRNKLIFTISLAYKFHPERGNHLNYIPVHMSFNLMKNLPVEELANGTADDTYIKNSFSWSEDHFGIENRLLSNVQKKEYRLQPKDIEQLNGELALAIRCLEKPFTSVYDRDIQHPFSVVINIKEEIRNETDFSLYNEMENINNLVAIGELDQELEADID